MSNVILKRALPISIFTIRQEVDDLSRPPGGTQAAGMSAGRPRTRSSLPAVKRMPTVSAPPDVLRECCIQG